MSEAARGTSPVAIPRIGGTFFGAVLAEVIGTFILVFVGAGTVVGVVLAGPDDPANVTAISLAFGLAVLVVVYALGHVSGAHINPTVTLGLAAVGRFPWRAVPAYVVAQFVGAILGALAVWAMFGEAGREQVALGATAPGDRGSGIAFLAEVILGFLLVLVVLASATDDRAIRAGAGLAIGFVIAGGIFVTLSVSGGSFNAARSLGPMIVAGDFPGWWIYLLAPAIGGVLGAFCYDYLIRSGAPPD
jgi:MIP family channel proteins